MEHIHWYHICKSVCVSYVWHTFIGIIYVSMCVSVMCGTHSLVSYMLVCVCQLCVELIHWDHICKYVCVSYVWYTFIGTIYVSMCVSVMCGTHSLEPYM